MGSYHNLSESARLALLEESRFVDFLPTTIYLILCVVVGVVGNGVVIFIYGFRLHGKHDGRYFISYLAVADLFAVVFSGIHHILIYVYALAYRSELLCKFSCFLTSASIVFSSLVILAIAAQRFLKVCRPLGKQMTLFWKRFSLLLSLMISVILAVPTFFIFGIEEVYNQELNVTGHTCDRLTTQDQSLYLVHSSVSLLLVLILWSVLIALYFKIAKVMYQQLKYGDHSVSAKKRRTTLMFMVISIIFILTFLPRLVTSLLASVTSAFWESLSGAGYVYVVAKISSFLYMLNNVANPFVYAFMDVKFWTEFKKVFVCNPATGKH